MMYVGIINKIIESEIFKENANSLTYVKKYEIELACNDSIVKGMIAKKTISRLLLEKDFVDGQDFNALVGYKISFKVRDGKLISIKFIEEDIEEDIEDKDTMDMKNLVFDKYTFYEYSFYTNANSDNHKISKSWVEECHGKTIEECNLYGYDINPEWCIRKGVLNE